MPAEAYQKTMDINLNSAIELSNLVYPIMKSQNSGNIIHISSIEGIHPSKFMSAYNISKAALIMLTKNQSIEWGKYNIRVNAICPGPTETGMTERALSNIEYYEDLQRRMPLQRWGRPDEIAAVISFLISTQASIVTGAVVTADGGMSANAGQFFPKEKS